MTGQSTKTQPAAAQPAAPKSTAAQPAAAHPASTHPTAAHPAAPEPRPDERGQVLVLAALAICVLIGMAGLALDLGVARVQQQSAQVAADAAAMAGADDLPGNVSAATAAALASAAGNHFVNGTGGVTVTVESPPTHSKSHNGDVKSLEVDITVAQATSFLRLFNLDTVSLRATAVATATPTSPTPPCAICVLAGGNVPNALLANGNAGIHVTGGGITVDSTSKTAMTVNGSASVSAQDIRIAGDYLASGNPSLSPEPSTGAQAVSDPLAGVPPPQVAAGGTTYAGTCPTVSGTQTLPGGTYTGTVCMNGSGTLNLSGPSTFEAGVLLNGNGTMNLSPGIYQGGVTVNGNGVLNLEPGVYVFEGPFLVDGTATVTGSGVMLYFTCSGYSAANPAPCGGSSGASLTMNGNSTYHLTAPASGTYQGLTVFYDRGNAGTLIIDGDGSSSLSGTFYAKSAAATLNGNPTAYQVNSMLIVHTATVNGNGTVDIGYSPAQNYQLPPQPGSSVLSE